MPNDQPKSPPTRLDPVRATGVSVIGTPTECVLILKRGVYFENEGGATMEIVPSAAAVMSWEIAKAVRDSLDQQIAQHDVAPVVQTVN